MVFTGSEPSAVIPLVNTGKAWVSLPHFSYGGMLFKKPEQNIDESAIILSIIEEIKSNSPEAGFYNYTLDDIRMTTEKHFIRTINNDKDNNFIKTEKTTSLLTLVSDERDLLKNISSNLRRKINKALKTDIIIKSGGTELLDDFYKVYVQNIYKLKSLCYSKQFLRDLLLSYNFGNIKLFVAYKDNTPIASALLASYNRFYENIFFATNEEYRSLYVSDLLHWEMISFSLTANKGKKGIYSFGRSTKGSGVHKYKSHWSVTDYPIYTFTNLSDIRKHSWLTNIWGLLPEFISTALSPHLIKHIY